MPSSPDALPGGRRPRASVIGAFLEGWRRVLQAPALAIGVLLLTLATALPLGVAVGGLIEDDLGRSLEGERSARAWNPVWMSEFSARTSGLGRTVTEDVLGFGATLAAVSQLVDSRPLDPAIGAAVAGYLAVWVFLSGGVLDRLARGRPVRVSAFFSTCGTYFFRFARLALLIGPCYWALFAWLHPWLFVSVYDRWTRDLTDEPQALVVRAVLYAVFLSGLAAVNLVADFAKVRAVVEDRRSMIGALGASLRFVRRRPLGVSALYLVNIAAALVVMRLWLQTAPDATAPVWLALLGGQLYLVGRIWARLAFMASEVAFFQGELAHAGYTARPDPVWPESAGVEAIRNLKK
jgi:hypothetical protein